MLTSRQIRGARGLLGWSARELAERAGVHITTVQRMEWSQGAMRGTVESLTKVERAFKAAGIEFFESQGVSLKQPRRRRRWGRS